MSGWGGCVEPETAMSMQTEIRSCPSPWGTRSSSRRCPTSWCRRASSSPGGSWGRTWARPRRRRCWSWRTCPPEVATVGPSGGTPTRCCGCTPCGTCAPACCRWSWLMWLLAVSWSNWKIRREFFFWSLLSLPNLSCLLSVAHSQIIAM